MKYKRLGNTGLKVSEIGLGTVELGMNYGFPGTDYYQKPEQQEAVRLVQRAVDLGINMIDTHRDYGVSEEIIGRALREITPRPIIASKVTIPPAPEYSGPFPPPPDKNMGSKQLRRAILGSIEASLKALRLETIDLMLIHNTTLESLQREDILPCLEEARQQEKIRFLGASTYGEAIPLEVMKNDRFRVLQTPFNLLDQKMADFIFPRAVQKKMGIFVRSAFLKGVLTSQIHNIVPEQLAPLREAALEVLKVLGEEVSNLAQVALRFCLSFSEISSTLIGVRSIPELESNLAVLKQGPFPPEILQNLRAFSIHEERLARPTYWGWT